jgi:hypothetical protein
MDRIENAVFNNDSIVVVEACLPIRCLETGSITLLFYSRVRVCCGRYLATATVYRVTAYQRIYTPQYLKETAGEGAEQNPMYAFVNTLLNIRVK